jgi:hypothetical protein
MKKGAKLMKKGAKLIYMDCDLCGRKFAGLNEEHVKSQIRTHKLFRHEGKD